MSAASEVIVIGGAPFAGKTTLAKRLAAQRGYALVAIDDLGTALRALTTPQSHPALHPMAGWDYRAYYVAHTPTTLIAHSRRERNRTFDEDRRCLQQSSRRRRRVCHITTSAGRGWESSWASS